MVAIKEPEILEQEPEAQELRLSEVFGGKAADLEGVFSNLDFPVSEEPISDLLETALGREQFYRDLMDNWGELGAQGQHYYDEFMWQNYAGHEGALAAAREGTEATSGKLPVNLEALGAAVDQNLERVSSETLSSNTVAGNRMEHRIENDIRGDMPIVGGPAVVAVAAIYERLLDTVDPSILDQAMGAGDGPEDYGTVLGEFRKLAGDNSALGAYIDDALAHEGIEQNVDDSAPQLAVAPPENVYDREGLNGPSSPGFS